MRICPWALPPAQSSRHLCPPKPAAEDRPAGGGSCLGSRLHPQRGSGFTGTSAVPSVPHVPQLSCLPRLQAKLTRTPALTSARGPSAGFVALPPRWLRQGADFSLPCLLCIGPTPPSPHSTPWGSRPGESREPDYQTRVTRRKNCSWREPSPRSLARPKPRLLFS